MKMNIIPKFGQDELKYTYESAKARMRVHPYIAKKYNEIINECPHYKTLDDAINSVNDEIYMYQIWAKIGKDEEFYYIQDYYIVTDDNRVATAAEYIGMEKINIG